MSMPNPVIPTYIRNSNQENYNEDLNQSLQSWLSVNGFPVPQITAANLTVIAPSMPNGSVWYVVDHVPPIWVGKQAGVLVQFTLAAYP